MKKQIITKKNLRGYKTKITNDLYDTILQKCVFLIHDDVEKELRKYEVQGIKRIDLVCDIADKIWRKI